MMRRATANRDDIVPLDGQMSLDPPLTVTVQRGVRSSVVRLDGELDIACDDRVRRTLLALAEEDRSVVLDLTRLRFCDVPGMRVLVDFTRAAHARGVHVEMRGASGQVDRMLDLTRTRGVLPLAG